MAIDLVIADDHPLVLQGLRHILATHAEFRVLATCTDGEAVLREVRKQRPDLLLLDLKMPKKNGLAVVRELRDEGLDVRIVVLTGWAEEEDMRRALQLGADAVFSKEYPSRALIHCLSRIHRGESWPERQEQNVAKRTESCLTFDERGKPLTRRETELVRLVARGLSNRDIADRLYITEGTVKLHLHHIFQKLGMRTRVKLTLYAHEAGLM